MDLPSSPAGSSDASSYDGSTRPTTPSSSPLFCASRMEDLALSHFMHSPCSASLQSFPAWGQVKNICVVGAGYVGGPTAAVLALYNPSIAVEVLDRDPVRIRKWKSPHLPVHEPGLVDVVRVTRDGAEIVNNETTSQVNATRLKRRANLFFTSDSVASISRADMIMLAVNTPTKTFGLGAGRATNMAAIDEAVRQIAIYAKPGTIIVEKSTVPCGTAQRIRNMLATLRPGVPFEVLSNPEFLSEGSAIENLISPDRVLIGSSGTPSGQHAARTLAQIYSSWVPSSRILEVNAWSSELAKLVANAMLAQRISSINSISAICEKTGAEVDQVAQAIGLDARIGAQFLKAGLGFGGSCFRKDIASLTYLAESLGLEDVAHYWSQVNVMNEMQRSRFARKVIERFDGNLTGRKIAMLGFAFKKNTGDTRESLAADVIRLLLEEKPMEIAIFDPFCHEKDIMREVEGVCGALDGRVVKVFPDPYHACSQADAVLIISDCDQFRNMPTKSKLNAFAPRTENKAVDTLPKAIASKDPEEDIWSCNGLSYRLPPQEACEDDCEACRSTASHPTATEPVEWARIAYNMKAPKLVIDGRGILDVHEMEKLGVHVDAVGRRPAVISAGIDPLNCDI
ncbi:UDP-glucose 6-dehydrogenase [Aspergillus udagawae]|nr:UDP-glucose 6-dehydrogenase [Aspergillus udagawae]